jgi:ABC-type dipeptide/oligopeptide/nickel transport system permease component
MLPVIFGRLLSAIPVLLIISVLAFGLQTLAPGDPARILVEASGLSPAPDEAVEAKREELGLDQPLRTQYAGWLADAVKGDLGRSYRSYQPVTEMYLDRIGATALLAVIAGSFSLIIGVPLGLLAAYHRGTRIDLISRIVALLGAAIPGFWLALVFMFIFSVQLGWLPAFGSVSLKGVILPAAVVALPGIAILTRLTRAAALDALNQDHVTVARMKGLSERSVILGHVLRNASTSVVTVFGLEMAGLLTGAAVVEYVFAWPGIGRMAIDAVLLRDIPVVVGFAVTAGIIFLTINLVVDIAVALIDPRIRST